jgi:hypothetical protein
VLSRLGELPGSALSVHAQAAFTTVRR